MAPTANCSAASHRVMRRDPHGRRRLASPPRGVPDHGLMIHALRTTRNPGGAKRARFCPSTTLRAGHVPPKHALGRRNAIARLAARSLDGAFSGLLGRAPRGYLFNLPLGAQPAVTVATVTHEARESSPRSETSLRAPIGFRVGRLPARVTARRPWDQGATAGSRTRRGRGSTRSQPPDHG